MAIWRPINDDLHLTRVFCSDSGSTSVEAAQKMALAFPLHRGVARPGITALEHAYHRDALRTMAIGACGVFNTANAPLLFDAHRLAGRGVEGYDGAETLAPGPGRFYFARLVAGLKRGLTGDAAYMEQFRLLDDVDGYDDATAYYRFIHP